MNLEILEQVNTSGEMELTLLESIQIDEIDASRVIPVRDLVGTPLSVEELTRLLQQIQPWEPFDPEVPDNYYARKVRALADEHPDIQNVEIPHHIGVKVALQAIVQKHGVGDKLRIRIS